MLQIWWIKYQFWGAGGSGSQKFDLEGPLCRPQKMTFFKIFNQSKIRFFHVKFRYLHHTSWKLLKENKPKQYRHFWNSTPQQHYHEVLTTAYFPINWSAKFHCLSSHQICSFLQYNQSINRSINASNYQSINQLINLSIN